MVYVCAQKKKERDDALVSAVHAQPRSMMDGATTHVSL